VLTNVDHRMAVMRDETFGPLIGIQVVADDAEAAALMRDTEYGLTAGVYTPDRSRAERLLAAMPTGTVYWNCCDRVTPRLPWSGRRHSGLGLTLSTHGIRAFAQPKAWHLRAGG
jgi:acyl-CoA reductase-like NAD-dependent aldehyde dehydrogenase